MPVNDYYMHSSLSTSLHKYSSVISYNITTFFRTTTIKIIIYFLFLLSQGVDETFVYYIQDGFGTLKSGWPVKLIINF